MRISRPTLKYFQVGETNIGDNIRSSDRSTANSLGSMNIYASIRKEKCLCRRTYSPSIDTLDTVTGV